ncbi:Ribonuclease R OS=Castellaniella defragrans OX=75697 GN=rnr PE=3 SV=1 [Castellaniella defragrans]
MERDGQLRFNPQGRLQICNNATFITGTVQGHRDGFGLSDSG